MESADASRESSLREIASLRATVTFLRSSVSELEKRLEEAVAGKTELETELGRVRARGAGSPRKSCGLSSSVFSEREETVLLAAELETTRGEMEALRREKTAALGDQCRTVERFQSLAEKYGQSEEERKRLET